MYSEDGPFSLSQAVKEHTKWIEKGRIHDPDKVEELLHKTRNYDKLPDRLKNTFEQNRDNWYYFPPESGTRITSTSIFNTEYALIGMSGVYGTDDCYKNSSGFVYGRVATDARGSSDDKTALF